MNDTERMLHTIQPIWNAKSKILILGSFPSVKSRESGFFYGHPQNRFWRVLSDVLDERLPKSIDEKKNLLLNNNIALWDVVASCDISGSSDSSIREVEANDIDRILNESCITQIFVNGATAERLYIKYIMSKNGQSAIRLPSTSPANAAWSYERLCCEWRIIRRYL